MLEYVSAVQMEACVPLEGSGFRRSKQILQASFLPNVMLPHPSVCGALLENQKVPQRLETWNEV